MDFLKNKNKNGYTQHNQDDFPKDDKKKLDEGTGPEGEEGQGRQLWAGRSDGFFGLSRVWGRGREP